MVSNIANWNDELAIYVGVKRGTSKAHEVFLKLLAKQKKPANPFDKARSQTWNPVDKSNPRNEM